MPADLKKRQAKIEGDDGMNNQITFTGSQKQIVGSDAHARCEQLINLLFWVTRSHSVSNRDCNIIFQSAPIHRRYWIAAIPTHVKILFYLLGWSLKPLQTSATLCFALNFSERLKQKLFLLCRIS